MSPNVPSTPYVGISPLRSQRPSVAPVLMTGTTTAPGNISFVSDSTTVITTGRRADGLLGVAPPTKETWLFGSASTSASLSLTELGGTPARMRQLRFALERFG